MDASHAQQNEKNALFLPDLVFNDLDEPVLTFDQQFRILFCNAAFEKLTGQAFASLQHQSLFAFFPELQESKLINNHVYQTEHWINAQKVLLKVIRQPLGEGNGVVIMKVKQLSETSYPNIQAVLEAIPQLAWTAMPDGSIHYMNNQWPTYTGRVVNEAAIWGKQSFFHPEDGKIAEQKWMQAILAGKVYEQKVRLRRAADNAYHLHQVRAVPVRNDNGMISFWIGTCISIDEPEKQLFRQTHQQEIQEEFSIIHEQLLTQIEERQKVEAKLKESQQFIEQVTELAPCLITVYNIHSGQYIFVNQALEEMLGYPRERLLTAGVDFLLSVMHPDDRARVSEENQQAIQQANARPETFGQTAVNFEYRLKDSKGQWRWVHTVGTVFKRKPDNTIESVLNVSVDITERKAIEKELKQKDQLVTHFLENFPVIFSRIDQQGFYLESVGSGLQAIDLADNQLAGKNVFEFCPQTEHQIRAVLQGEKTTFLDEFEYQGEKKCFQNYYFYDKENACAIGFSIDITDQREAEEKLQESRLLIEQITSTMPDILYVYDTREHRNIYVNKEITQLLGYSPEELKEISPEINTKLLHPDDFEQLDKNKQALSRLPDGAAHEWEYRMKHKNGEYLWFCSREVIFKRTPEGKPVLVLGVAQNITERKHYEEELKNKNQIIEGILSNLPVIVSRIDKQGVIQEAVGSGLRRVGRSDNEIKGVNIFETYPQIAHLVAQAINGNSISFTGTPQYQGETKYFLNHYFYDAEKACAVGFSIDITEQKETEQKLIESENKLRQLNEELERRVKERTSALAASEERFELAARVTHDIIWDWDLHSHALTYNTGYTETLGYTPDEILPTIEEWNRNIHQEDAARVKNSIQTVIESGTHEWKEEYRHKRKDQTYAWVFNRGYVQHSASGKPVRMVGAMTDITERRQSEEKLRASEAKFRRLFDSDVIGIIFWNLDGLVTDANNAFLAMMGYTYEDLLQKQIDWRVLTPEEYTAGDQKALLELETTGVHAPVKKVYIHKKGFRVPVLVGGAYLEGYTDRGVSYILDMTDLENALRDLALSEERFQLVAKAANDAIRDWNLVTDIVWWNEGFRNLFGYTTAETEIGPESWYSRIHPEEQEKILQSQREAIEQNSTQWSSEYRFRRSDGSYAYILDRGYILHNDKGKPMRILSSMLDITHLKETQEALEQQAVELKRSNADLEQFAFISSHDLQEPLNTASSFAKLLERRYKNQLDAEADEFINFIVTSTERMKILVRSLLNYSKINSSNKQLAPVDLSAVLQQVKENLKTSIEHTKASITSDPLPVLQANEGQMVQLFQHLINNAIKFRSENPLEVKIQVTSKPKYYLFTVCDNGIGIEMKYAEKIFQVFQRLHSRDEYEGAGMGLATCKRIVEKHGGAIWVESELGKGASFYFTLTR